MKKQYAFVIVAALIAMAIALCGCNGRGEHLKEENGENAGLTVYVDPETGVEYVYRQHGYGGGMSVRYNADGTVKVAE